MRIRAERDDLADIFSRANRAIGARTAVPVLQGLLCEVSGSNLWVTGTDHEMTVKAATEVEVLEEGRVVIPGKLLADAVRRMPAGPVTIGSGDGDVEIVGKGPRFSVRPWPPRTTPRYRIPRAREWRSTAKSWPTPSAKWWWRRRPIRLDPYSRGCCSSRPLRG